MLFVSVTNIRMGYDNIKYFKSHVWLAPFFEKKTRQNKTNALYGEAFKQMLCNTPHLP